MVLSSKGKLLSCLFLSDVLCSHVKGQRSGVMDRCMKCRHYQRFLSIMDEKDQKIMDEIDRIRGHEPHG